LNWGATARALRLPLGFLLAIVFAWLARPTPMSLAIGGAVAAIGLGVRAWATGHIVKNDRLATTGPYAHTRNPLYFGSFLIACGFALAGGWIFLLVVAAFFLVIYAPVMARERAKVSGLFPEAYAEWARHVPMFVPRLVPWRDPSSPEATPFSGALYRRHKEWRAALGFLAGIAFLWWRVRSGT
jgi:protein-S-isoprenylcysteine O-methyltransferase Ste14